MKPVILRSVRGMQSYESKSMWHIELLLTEVERLLLTQLYF
jgi:hypothetical protein